MTTIGTLDVSASSLAASTASVIWLEIFPAPLLATGVRGRRCVAGETDCGGKMAGNVTSSPGAACSPDPNNEHEMIKQVELIPLTVLILLTNFLVIGFLVSNRKFHTPTYIFIGSLGISDIFVGIVSIVTIVTKASESSQGLCLARIGFTVASLSASVWSLTCVAVDRYIAVTRALMYKSIMTRRKTLYGITWSWVFSFLTGFLPLMGWRESEESYGYYCSFMYVLTKYYILFLFTVSAIIPLTTMFVIYALLFKAARYHIKRIEIIENLQGERKTSGLFGISSRTLRSVKTFTAVYGCVVVTWAPFLCTTLVQLFVQTKNCDLQEVIGTHLLVLGFSNSFLNPLIYAIGTKDFRTKVKLLLRKRCHNFDSQVFPSSDR